ncbi:hypothetical protein CRENBAI_026175 [Crenichthys baileyi]|uniref:MADF domain-containing protein n=1 Tax=Crenichthys baileyi TaxID=28760 RepID=A0AAV9RPA0_9TELE
MEDKIIVVVCAHPIIYDTSSYHYRDRNRKDLAWRRINKEVGISGKLIQLGWGQTKIALKAILLCAQLLEQVGGDQEVVPSRHRVQAGDQEVVPSRHRVQAGARTSNTESWAVGGEGVETGDKDVEADRSVETVAACDGNLQVGQEADRAE